MTRELEVLGTSSTESPSGCVIDLRVPEDLFYFQGHFDGDPVLPGVVQIDEVLTQVERVWPELGRLERARRVKFIRIIRPGTKLLLTLTRRADPAQVAFRIDSAGEACSSGILVFTSA